MNVATVIEFIESMVKSATVSNVDGAYGSGMASGTNSFDILSFIKKPQVILRVVSIVRESLLTFFLNKLSLTNKRDMSTNASYSQSLSLAAFTQKTCTRVANVR